MDRVAALIGPLRTAVSHPRAARRSNQSKQTTQQNSKTRKIIIIRLLPINTLMSMVKKRSRFHSKIIIVMDQIKKSRRIRPRKEKTMRSQLMKRRRIRKANILVASSSEKQKVKAHLEK